MSCLRRPWVLLFLLVWLWRLIIGLSSVRRNGLSPRTMHNPVIGTLVFTAAAGATTTAVASSWGQDTAPTLTARRHDTAAAVKERKERGFNVDEALTPGGGNLRDRPANALGKILDNHGSDYSRRSLRGGNALPDDLWDTSEMEANEQRRLSSTTSGFRFTSGPLPTPAIVQTGPPNAKSDHSRLPTLSPMLLTCNWYVNEIGESLCIDGYAAGDGEVLCYPSGCDQATCCELDDTGPQTRVPSTDPSPSPQIPQQGASPPLAPAEGSMLALTMVPTTTTDKVSTTKMFALASSDFQLSSAVSAGDEAPFSRLLFSSIAGSDSTTETPTSTPSAPVGVPTSVFTMPPSPVPTSFSPTSISTPSFSSVRSNPSPTGFSSPVSVPFPTLTSTSPPTSPALSMTPTSSPTGLPSPVPVTFLPTITPTSIPTPTPSSDGPISTPSDFPSSFPFPSNFPLTSTSTSTPIPLVSSVGLTSSLTSLPTSVLITFSPTSSPKSTPTPPFSSVDPSSSPTGYPSPIPFTVSPTIIPTSTPTPPFSSVGPSSSPTGYPSPVPISVSPTTIPTSTPTPPFSSVGPSSSPTGYPSPIPISCSPTTIPTFTPTPPLLSVGPSSSPTVYPSPILISGSPTTIPTFTPTPPSSSVVPSSSPTFYPSPIPISVSPTTIPPTAQHLPVTTPTPGTSRPSLTDAPDTPMEITTMPTQPGTPIPYPDIALIPTSSPVDNLSPSPTPASTPTTTTPLTAQALPVTTPIPVTSRPSLTDAPNIRVETNSPILASPFPNSTPSPKSSITPIIIPAASPEPPFSSTSFSDSFPPNNVDTPSPSTSTSSTSSPIPSAKPFFTSTPFTVSESPSPDPGESQSFMSPESSGDIEATTLPSGLSTSTSGQEGDDDDGDSPDLTISRIISVVVGIAVVTMGTNNIASSNTDGNTESSAGSSRNLMESGPVPVAVPGVTSGNRYERRRVSRRKPEFSLALVIISQLQFLAMLSLVDSVSGGNSVLADFVLGIRWTNLWWEPEFANDIAPDRCSTTRGGNALGPLAFIGNLFLLGCILTGLFALHVTIISAVEAFWLTRDHARDEASAARRRGISMGELRSRLLAGGGPSSERIYLPAWRSPGSSLSDEEKKSDDEGKQGDPAANSQTFNPVTVCRDKSHSVWLHYPHVELFVLFFAFDGAVASQVAAIRSASDCGGIFYLATISLLLYPLLLFIVVWRAIVVRVLPGVLLVFKRFATDESDRRGFFRRMQSTYQLSYSMFSWADRGEWETVTTSGDVETIRNGDWFRIGFEPMFVDYTKEGTWYILISFVQGAAIACVGVLVNDSITQLFVFCGIDLIVFAFLLLKRPFANSFINGVAAFLLMINVVCMALLGMSALQWEGVSTEADVNSAVLIMQLVALILLIVPVYLDLSVIVIGAIIKKYRQCGSSQMTGANESEDERDARMYVRSYIRRKWCYTWCAMLSHNVATYAKDVSNGLRKAKVSDNTNEKRVRSSWV